MAQMKKQNTRKRTNQCGDSQPISCRVQNTSCQNAQKSHRIRQKQKTNKGSTKGNKKKNPQETNSEGKDARIQINDWEHKEEIGIQPEQNKETRTQKNEESLRRLWDISKRANI